MEKDRASPSPRSSRSRKLPSPGATSRSVDVRTGVDSSDEAPTKDVASNKFENLQEKAGVAYISENLIKRITKEENLSFVTTLHITLGKDLNKKIKYIENLDNLKRLLQLKLNDHMIEKIERLDHLTHLRELHLAKNRITKIEGLDFLVRLKVLNLSGNLVEHLPPGVFKKLKELQAFHVAHNQLTSLVEITRLRPLPDLISLSVEGNPLAQLQHSRQFVIFQLRTLESLDRKQISEDERRVADERFAQEEVRRLEAEVSHQQKDYESLLEEKLQAINEVEQLTKLHTEQKLQIIEDVKKIKELQRELEAKEELLKSKTTELSKACEKQFKLEQELAFYKLDAKFKHLGMLPLPEGVEFGDEEDDESPYIGKARFKPNTFARESNTLSIEQEGTVYLTPMSSRHVDGYNKQNKVLQQEVHGALILDLQEKEKAIKQAEEDLEQLNDQLNRRKTQLQDAGDKLALIQQAIDDQAHLLGEEERKLIEGLADKTNYIRKLQQVAKDLEEGMNRLADGIAQGEDDTDKLRLTVQSTSPDDLAYPHLQTKLAARESQLEELIGEYSKLKRDYDKAQARLQEEMAALKTLETQLQAARKTHGDQDQLKDELKNIIDDLNDNLNRMKQQVAQQGRQISQLQQEKDALGQRLSEMHQQKSNNKLLKDNVAKLQQQLKLNEDALDKERRSGEMLRHRMSDLETQTSEGAATELALAEGKRKLREAEAEIARLQNALNKAKQQMQDDRHAIEERLRKEQERVDKALQAARNAGDKERESKDLRAKVDALTGTNASLSERLKEAEVELGNFENLLDKEEVLERLNTLKDDIDRNREGVRLPRSDQDDLGKALADLHQKYLDLVRDLEKHWLDKERKNKKADDELEFLTAKLQNSESALKQANDRSSQLAKEKEDRDARLKKMAAELKKLENKLRNQEQLEDELEGAKAAHAEELGRLKDQVAMLNDELRRAREGIHDELFNAREPLQTKIRELEKDTQKLEKKFSKAKADNEKLQATVSDLEANRRDLEDKIAELMGKLREAWIQAEKKDKKAWQRGVLETKVKGLGDELQRTRERLKNLHSEAADKLQAEKQKAANKIQSLEDEIDALKDRMRRLQDKAEDELNRVRDAAARKVRHLEDGLINLRDQLQEERARRDEELRKARAKEAALEDRLRENDVQLQRSAQKRQAQEFKLRNLQQQIDELGKSLKEAETRTVKEQLDKELEALKAEQRQAAAQAAAARQLADAEKQVATLQSLLDAKDRDLQDQINHGVQNASDLAAQRSEISNLASALAAQNTELGRLKEDLAEISKVHVAPPYFHAPDHSLSALANEVQALRSALMHKQQHVETLTRSLSGYPHIPVTTAALTAPPVSTQTYLPTAVPATAQVTFAGGDVEGVSTLPGLVTAPDALAASPQGSFPGQVVHHHHFAKRGVQGKKKPKLLSLPANSSTISPMVAGSTNVSTSPVTSVHHHFYDEASGKEGDKQQAKKRTKRKQQQEEVLWCNVPEHDGLEYEVGRLQGFLASSMQTQKTQSQRDSIRIELKDLENEVEDSLKRRATARQSQQHSLDATLAKFQGHLLTLVDHKSRLSS